jgi:hypothetical protein
LLDHDGCQVGHFIRGVYQLVGIRAGLQNAPSSPRKRGLMGSARRKDRQATNDAGPTTSLMLICPPRPSRPRSGRGIAGNRVQGGGECGRRHGVRGRIRLSAMLSPTVCTESCRGDGIPGEGLRTTTAYNRVHSAAGVRMAWECLARPRRRSRAGGGDDLGGESSIPSPTTTERMAHSHACKKTRVFSNTWSSVNPSVGK